MGIYKRKILGKKENTLSIKKKVRFKKKERKHDLEQENEKVTKKKESKVCLNQDKKKVTKIDQEKKTRSYLIPNPPQVKC